MFKIKKPALHFEVFLTVIGKYCGKDMSPIMYIATYSDTPLSQTVRGCDKSRTAPSLNVPDWYQPHLTDSRPLYLPNVNPTHYQLCYDRQAFNVASALRSLIFGAPKNLFISKCSSQSTSCKLRFIFYISGFVSQQKSVLF